MTPTSPTSFIDSPVIEDPNAAPYVGDLSALFPTILPQVEVVVYQRVREMCSRRSIFPSGGEGLPFPITFDVTADVPLPLDEAGNLPVLRGWPTFPGAIPAIGIAETTTSEDMSEQAVQAGFVTDSYASLPDGTVIGTCAYYAHPIHTSIVVELIHTNRDERDRLHDQLYYRVLQPLRRILPAATGQIREVHVTGEKQDLPQDELPMTMYLSLITVDVFGEALIPDEITLGGIVTEIDVTVTPLAPDTTIPTRGLPRDPTDLT